MLKHNFLPRGSYTRSPSLLQTQELVKGKNETVVEYSLAGYQNPISVAEWKNQIIKALPEELRSSLPSVEEIEKELE